MAWISVLKIVLQKNAGISVLKATLESLISVWFSVCLSRIKPQNDTPWPLNLLNNMPISHHVCFCYFEDFLAVFLRLPLTIFWMLVHDTVIPVLCSVMVGVCGDIGCDVRAGASVTSVLLLRLRRLDTADTQCEHLIVLIVFILPLPSPHHNIWQVFHLLVKENFKAIFVLISTVNKKEFLTEVLETEKKCFDIIYYRSN